MQLLGLLPNRGLILLIHLVQMLVIQIIEILVLLNKSLQLDLFIGSWVLPTIQFVLLAFVIAECALILLIAIHSRVAILDAQLIINHVLVEILFEKLLGGRLVVMVL